MKASVEKSVVSYVGIDVAKAELVVATSQSNAVFARVIRLTFFRAPTRTSLSGYPAAGTRRFSIPRAVPMNSTSAP